MLPSPEVFAQAAGEFGIDNDTMVIIYDQGNLFSAPRARWTLKTFGVKNLRILQGGLNARPVPVIPPKAVSCRCRRRKPLCRNFSVIMR